VRTPASDDPSDVIGRDGDAGVGGPDAVGEVTLPARIWWVWAHWRLEPIGPSASGVRTPNTLTRLDSAVDQIAAADLKFDNFAFVGPSGSRWLVSNGVNRRRGGRLSVV